jgi:SAM-dependent methyltransferase
MKLSITPHLPAPLYRVLRDLRYGRPPLGWAKFGHLRRLTPIIPDFGFGRGLPIDRYYIEQFLTTHSRDIQGHVLEIKEPLYTHRFGGNRVTKSDVLHVEPGNPHATLVADLTQADHLPADTFDCIILTQTLPFIYDVQAAVNTLHRILKPSGVLLATVPGISQISSEDMERWGQYWCFTTRSMEQLLTTTFFPDQVTVATHGNVLAAITLLHGLVTEELKPEELNYVDPNYQVLITARAVKGSKTNGD